MGAITINAGIWALSILQQPSLTLPGKTVLAATETRTVKEIVQLWSKVSGKPAEFVSVSLGHYDSLWPKWGREVGLMLQLWDVARERSWVGEDGEKVLTKDDLGVKGLVGMEEYFGSCDWSSI